MSALGYTLPAGPIVFEARTVIVAVAVGVGVTVISAVGPARRAVRIAPVAAMSDRQDGAEVSPRRRLVSGAAVGLVGVVALAAGLALPQVGLVGLGAACIFTGAAMLAPAVARPLSSVIGRPLARLRAVPGRLGRENSMRSPRRTAQTASALMIGIALVSAMAVFGASVSRSATSSVDDAIKADLIVSGTASGPGSFSPGLARALTELPGVNASLIAYGGQFEIRQSVESLKGVSTQGYLEDLDPEHDGRQRRHRPRRRRAAHRLQHGQFRPPERRRYRPGEVRPDRRVQHDRRGHLQGQRPDRQLLGRPGLFPVALPGSHAGRRPVGPRPGPRRCNRRCKRR